jgi:alpha-glucosidase
MLYGFLFLVGMHLMSDGSAEMNSIGRFERFSKTQHSLVADYDSGKTEIQFFKSEIIHVSIQCNARPRKSFAVVEEPDDLSEHKFDMQNKKEVSISLGEGRFSYLAEPLRFSYKPLNATEGIDLTNIQFSNSGVVASFDIHGARNFYGLGEKTLPFNKYGTRDTMWNSDFPAYSVKFDPLYESVPFLLKADTHGAYGLFFDNTFRSTFDVGASDGRTLIYKTAGGAFELYLITGRNAAEVVQKFSELTGKMHMPPIWALGYQQSRWSYYPQQKVINLARGFRERKIPCDVIYLDINYMNGYRCFTWSPHDFPDPKEMLGTLHNLGFKVVTIIDPGIKYEKGYGVYDSGVKDDIFVREKNGKYFVGQVWPGDCVFPDFFNQKAREWWGKQYKALVDSGVDGFWNDMNEPSVFNTPNKTFPLDAIHKLDRAEGVGESDVDTIATHAELHNVYGMEMARATCEGLEKLVPNKRHFVLTRANYAGGQRFAAMWTGDNFASFAHLRLALVMFLNLGVSGQPFVGSDVGGFIGNPSAELFTRWLELGSFSPFFRTHSVWESKPREPWAFDSESTAINREIIERRYQLLPEIYSIFQTAHRTGLPIVKPLYLNFPYDEQAYNISDEFLFGDNMLVAPVFDSGVVSRKVYLPNGKWLSFYDASEFGGGWHDVDAPLGKTPLFVKDGTMMFIQSVVQSTAEQADTLILRVYGDRAAIGRGYFDDGLTLAYKRGDFLVWNVSAEKTGSTWTIKFNQKGRFKPDYKFLSVELFTRTVPHHLVMGTSTGKQYTGKITKQAEDLLRVTFPFDIHAEEISLSF